MDDLTFDKLKEDMRNRSVEYMRNTVPYNTEVSESSGFISGVMWALKKLNKLGLLKDEESKEAIPNGESDLYYHCPICGEFELEKECENYCPKCG
jgi:rubrerythrin